MTTTVSRTVSRRTALIGAGLLPFAWSAPALAAPISFQVALTGAKEVPPVETSGKGTADITYDQATRAVNWTITYSGLTSPVTMAHFHHAAAGKNGPVQVWLTKKGAPVKSPITGSATLTPQQAEEFMGGDWYINVHTTDHPAGAIRGEVKPPKS
jgi:hypothetical protein